MVSPDGDVSGSNPGNYTTTAAYNADGKETSVTQGNGSGYTDTPRETQYGYDGDGNQSKAEDARGYTTTTTFNADNQATLVTNPDGDSTLTCYDGDGNAAQTVPATGVAASDLTPASCPTAYPAGYSVRLADDASVSTYDAASQVVAKTTPAAAGQSGYETTSYSFDPDGNPIKTTAPATSDGGAATVTMSTYNAADQLVSQTLGYGTPSASTTSYCYDPDGDKTAAIYADGDTAGTAACSTSYPWTVTATPQATYETTYTYDSVGELVSMTTPKTAAAPGGGTTTATYDPAGNKLTSVDPDGVTTTWTYTPLNEIDTVTYSGSSAHSVSYTYDASGNESGMTDATGTSSYIYDSFGELTSAENGAGQTVGYAYNPDGKVTGVTYPLPSTATWASTDTAGYGYDDADQLTSVTDFNGHQISVSNNANGLPATETLASTGDSIATTYSSGDGIEAIALKNASSTLQSFTYTYMPSGNIGTETDTPSSSSSSPQTYTYDAQGQVTSDTPGTETVRDYGFDASGNLTTLPAGATGSYDDAGELTSSTSSGAVTNYSYNADGEQLTSTQGSTTESSAAWNGAQQLTSYSNSAADMTAATYNGDGLRSSSVITPSGASAISQEYVWNVAPSVPQLMMDGTNAYIYAGGGSPAEQVNLSTGTATYLVADELGSIRGTVSAAGALTGTATYDAWGNPLGGGSLISITPFGYAGGYTDPDGLSYLVNRYYDPVTGQFLSVDPDLSETLAPYSYATGDPVLANDPTGDSVDTWTTFGGKISGTCCDDIGVNWSISNGVLIDEINGHGMYIYAFSFWAWTWVGDGIRDPQFFWTVLTPRDGNFKYSTKIFPGKYGTPGVGNPSVGAIYPIPVDLSSKTWQGHHGTDGYIFTYVNKTFETTPTSQPEVRMSMWVEDPTNPKARAAACRTYFTLG